MSVKEENIVFILYIYCEKPDIFCVPKDKVPKDLKKDTTVYDNDHFLRDKFGYHKYFGEVFTADKEEDDYDCLKPIFKKQYDELMIKKPIFEEYKMSRNIHFNNVEDIFTVHFSIQG